MVEMTKNFSFDYEHSQHLIMNESCDWNLVPSAVEYIESLGSFGVGLIGVGSVLTVLTFYLIVDAVYNITLQNETVAYKTNCLIILSIYPIASLCSLLATAMPRAQLLSESLTQICLTVSLYRLFLLLIDLGHRSVSKPPPMLLKVGPCCCWPCLPFPNPEMNRINLTWLRLCVLQFTIVQGLTSCVILFLDAEGSLLARVYGAYLQPMALTSLLIGLYGLTVATKSLQDCSPDPSLPRRTMVCQMVLLFSKLQGFIVKSLPSAGVFPCHPPLTPEIYANLTYNFLMLIEMMMLAYAARKIYVKVEGRTEEAVIIETCVTKNILVPAEVRGNNELANVQHPVPITALTTSEDVHSRVP
ncbi:uncharacterized protein LOC124413264 [Diprion similis]|uniref:uncharacterized protein LOC124413264 n=1 Tax=Diprion similis TaxID=362088 RepID=UPI001EF79D97|nr:uncharacterized protein LOC124413264 [Diprion similis]